MLLYDLEGCVNLKGLFWGVILVIAGLSGSYVLNGTSSSGALVIVGLVIIGFGIRRISLERKKDHKMMEIYNDYVKNKDEE
jgi:hypothetical protein